MVFQIPENVAPECYPMAWLIGRWCGAGVLEYQGIDAAGYLHEVSIDNDDGGPYLRVNSRVWLIAEPAGAVDKEMPGLDGYASLTKERLWSSLAGYLRATPGMDKRDGATMLEGLTASPAGYAMTWAGLIKGPQLQMQADAIATTPTAVEQTGGRIMAGLVESDLFLAYDMAAFGHEMSSYMAGRLSRVTDE
ncbi:MULTISPECIES: FABP family protein [unclassified Actinobaculum]|uniref:FABP family protein n=1 Tax=unclassified Actinobaculum TaxID=2609299 RepID=UPI000D5294D7|nr:MULTISPECIES: FABP family protein [unclassified Actinobaculum]AWE43035.1 FABP family protein [Actinobaculum sp. 313]RTE48578.1 FABP family protein [Actinobaculum sp. 352]